MIEGGQYEIQIQKKSIITVKGEHITIGTNFSTISDLTKDQCIKKLVKYVSYNDAQDARGGNFTRFKWFITLVCDGCFVKEEDTEKLLNEARDLLLFRKL